MERVWAGIDAGKEIHWAHVLDASGEKLLSRKVTNDEGNLSALIDEALLLADEVVWAIDQPGGGATLLLGLLWEREQRVLYMPGFSVDRSREIYPGESKTDVRDAHVIADQARMRPGLQELTADEEDLAELEILLARRRDLVTDQTRSVNRLRDALLSSFPALESTLDLTQHGALILVSNYQTPSAIRGMGKKRLADFLKKRSVRGAEALANKALTSAKSQSVTLPAEEVTARIVAELAGEVLSLKQNIETLDAELRQRFFARPEAEILTSLPGVGVTLGAEFLVAAGNLSAFESADKLAAYAGLVPAAHDSGKRVGNDKRMRGGNKALKYVFYQSAFASLRGCPESKAFYDRKRAQGKLHTQALIALARRRVNVLWAMLRDGTTFQKSPSGA